MTNGGTDDRLCIDVRTLRRDLLKAMGGALGASAVGSTAAVAAEASIADGPTVETYAAHPLDLSDLTEPSPPDDPDIGGQGGSSEVEEIERHTPAGSGKQQGPSGDTRTASSGQTLDVTNDYDGFGTRDVVRGVDLDDSGEVEPGEIFFTVPSDAQLGTGETEHVVSINSEVGIYDKTSGERLHHFRLEDWFGNVLSLADGDEPPAQFENIQVFDPRVRYDARTGRFLLACVEFNLPDEVDGEPVEDPNDLTGAFLLSISDSSDPTGTWTNYRIPPLSNGGLVDFPQLGYGPGVVTLTQNFFALPDFAFEGATMVTLDKDDLLTGDDVTALHFTDLRNLDGSLAFTVQPARIDDGADAFYLANTRYFSGQTVTVWTVENPTDPDTVGVTNDGIRVRPYHNAPSAKQPETEDKIDTGDTRFVDAIAHDPETGHLWAAHTVNDGSARWYEIDPADGSLVQAGQFTRNDLPTFYPTIEANGESAVFVYNTSGPKNSETTGKNYASIEVAGRTSDFPEGALEDFAVVKNGETEYDYVNPGEGDPGSQTMRWGDYNGISVDPDDGSYWVISQYANDPDTVQTYRTRIANVDFQ